MADFQSGLISRIFSCFLFVFFQQFFFTQNNSKWYLEWILKFCLFFFFISLFDPRWRVCKGYRLCMMADFQNGLIYQIFSVFFKRFFAQNNSKSLVKWVLTYFLEFSFSCLTHSLWILADFHKGLISRIFSAFSSGFLNRAIRNGL